MKLKGFDLFAGCGGLSLGLKAAGIDIAWANEINKHAAATYRQTHDTTTLFEEDISVTVERLRSKDSDLPEPGEVHLVAGGPPCQGFSGYNRFRKADDPRNSLVEPFLEVVDILKPTYSLIENVTGLLAMNKGQVLDRILESLKELGYNSRLGILQAGGYGIPQSRWRVFVIASKASAQLPELPLPTHRFPRINPFGATNHKSSIIKPLTGEASLFEKPQESITVWDAIGNLPILSNGGGTEYRNDKPPAYSSYQQSLADGSEGLFDHQTVRLGDLMLERCKAIPKRPGAGWLDLPEHLQPRNLVRHGDRRYGNRFGRLDWGGYFNTILQAPKPYWGRVFHPEQDRVISAREAARAQGFPDRVKFHGSLLEKYRQIGNAVPPQVGYAWGMEIMRSWHGD